MRTSATRAVVTLLPAAMALGLSIAVSSLWIDRTHDALVEAEVSRLMALLDVRHDEIELLVDSYAQKADLMASRTRLRRLLGEHSTGGAEGAGDEADVARVAEMSTIAGDAAASDVLIADVHIADTTGVVIAGSDPEVFGTPLAALGFGPGPIDAASASGELHVVVDGDAIELLAAAPLVVDGAERGSALIVFTPDAADPLTHSTPFGRSGELLLGFRPAPGDEIVVTTPSRRSLDDGSAASNEVTALMTDAVAADGPGIVAGRAGEPVIGVARHIDATGWGMVAKVDTAEVAGRLDLVRDGVIVLGLGLTLIGGVTGLFAGRWIADEQDSRSRAEARFRSVFTSAPIAMLLVAGDGRIRRANDRAGELLGYSDQVLATMSVDDLVPRHAAQHHGRLRARFVDEAVSRSMGEEGDVVAVGADGDEIPVEIGLTPIETDEGPMVVAAVVDLSARRRAEELLEHRAGELERSNHDLDAFAAVASHDLKAPLRVIGSLAGFVLEDAGDELSAACRDDVEEIRHRADRMTEMLNGLLEYARIGREPGAGPCPIDVGEMLADLSRLYVPADRFELLVDDDLPVPVVPRAAAELVFRNLLMNAVHHHHGASGTITITGRREGDTAIIVVADDGPGIPAEARDRVFDLFTTGRRRGDTSTGMGLALIKRAVETNGGQIGIVDGPSTGAVFEVRWPCAVSEPTFGADGSVPERKATDAS